MRLQLNNRIDEQGRFSGLEVILGNIPKNVDTHTISYLYLREQYQSMGLTMGLDSDRALYQVLEYEENIK